MYMLAKGNGVFGIGVPVQVWALSFSKKICARASFGVHNSLTTPFQAFRAEACERSGHQAESRC